MKPNIIYLHGFASSPMSQKAQALQAGFGASGITLNTPDLNRPSFEQLTLTAMLHHLAGVVRACPPGPVYLIGSSMGGLAAVHFVNRFKEAEARRVELLFLLAPAFDFLANRRRVLGEAGMKQWEQDGWLEVHNYATDSPRRVHYGLVEDIAAYDSYSAHVDIPVMIFHGRQDESVPLEQSQRFANDRANVRLNVVDSDHSLLSAMDTIWTDMVNFFAL